jgi:hypothetical protein
MDADDEWRLDDDGWECPCALCASQDARPYGNGIKALPITRLPRPSAKGMLVPRLGARRRNDRNPAGEA